MSRDERLAPMTERQAWALREALARLAGCKGYKAPTLRWARRWLYEYAVGVRKVLPMEYGEDWSWILVVMAQTAPVYAADLLGDYAHPALHDAGGRTRWTAVWSRMVRDIAVRVDEEWLARYVLTKVDSDGRYRIPESHVVVRYGTLYQRYLGLTWHSAADMAAEAAEWPEGMPGKHLDFGRYPVWVTDDRGMVGHWCSTVEYLYSDPADCEIDVTADEAQAWAGKEAHA